MKLPRWAAILFIVIFLTTGKAGRARAGVLDRVRDEARSTGLDHDAEEPRGDGGKLARVRGVVREEGNHGHRHHLPPGGVE